jgi:hypothetical protein
MAVIIHVYISLGRPAVLSSNKPIPEGFTGISESTGFTQFKLDGVYMPTMIHQLPESNMALPGIRTFTQQVLQNLAAVHNAIIMSCVFQWHYVNMRQHQEPTIKQEDLVYLSTKNLDEQVS